MLAMTLAVDALCAGLNAGDLLGRQRLAVHQAAFEVEQVVLALRGALPHQRQVRGDERPLVITHITRVRLPCRLGRVHTLTLRMHLPEVHNRL